METKQFCRGGFTLIELPVVVFILVLLVAVLLPALAKAREHPKSICCASNFWQLGLAVGQYADDNGGLCVGNRSSSPTPPWTWEHVLVDTGYLEDYALMECPSEKMYVNAVKANLYFVGDGNGGTALDKDNADELYLIVDARGNQMSHQLYDIPFYYYPLLDTWKLGGSLGYYGNTFDDYFTPRHMGGFNVLFADQHVERQDRYDVTRDNLVP